MSAIQAFVAAHHLKLFVVLFTTYVLPALVRWGLLKARALPPGSKWDVRLRKIMKVTLDTTNYDDAEHKLAEAEHKILEAVDAIVLADAKLSPSSPPTKPLA